MVPTQHSEQGQIAMTIDMKTQHQIDHEAYCKWVSDMGEALDNMDPSLRASQAFHAGCAHRDAKTPMEYAQRILNVSHKTNLT